MDNLTTDISRFGYRERRIAEKLLHLWNKNGLPKDFYEDEIQIMFNCYSGFVFLTNSEFQVAMIKKNKLESFYNCPECGFEGFQEDFKEGGNDCCKKFISEIKAIG